MFIAINPETFMPFLADGLPICSLDQFVVMDMMKALYPGAQFELYKFVETVN